MCAELRDRGYCMIPGVVPRAKMVGIAAAYDRAFAEGTPPDLRASVGSGNTRLTDFVNRGVEFDDLYVLEPVLAACFDTIGPRFKLSSFHGRTVLPGAAAQRLHVDVRRDQDPWPLIGFIFMVDEFRIDNGATRFVPGSHRAETRGGVIHEGNHRPETGGYVPACGEPGSVVIYFGSTWHGYLANRSASPRRSIQGAYVSRSGQGAHDWASRMKAETLVRLSPLQRDVLALD